MKITEVKEKQVIHCKTKEEFDRICEILNVQGLNLKDGRPFSEISWYALFEKTCINVKEGLSGSEEYYAVRGYKIIDSTLIYNPFPSEEAINGTYEGLKILEEARSKIKAAKEAVSHPAHYGSKDDPYEVIKVIDAWGLDFSLGNVTKYVARAGKKDPAKEIEDLKKAAQYLQFAINKREAKL